MIYFKLFKDICKYAPFELKESFISLFNLININVDAEKNSENKVMTVYLLNLLIILVDKGHINIGPIKSEVEKYIISLDDAKYSPMFKTLITEKLNSVIFLKEFKQIPVEKPKAKEAEFDDLF